MSLLNRYAAPSSCWILYIGIFAFPFSVAATNLLLALFIVYAMFSGVLIRGAQHMWHCHRQLSWAITAYMLLMLIGLLWSLDMASGLRVLFHQWMWLLMPCLIGLFLVQPKTRDHFWLALSAGLTAHLIFCVIQSTGWGSISPMEGSSPEDATGYIGHIGFGFVYGIWAGWLIHWGLLQQNWRYRAVSWGLATWSLYMIFAADGRSGYLISIIILMFLLWTHLIKKRSPSTIATLLLLIPSLFLAVLLTNLDHPRLQFTLQSVHYALEDKPLRAEPRWLLWRGAVEMIKENPILGVGTGGYKNAVQSLSENRPIYKTIAHFDHPHQLYLLMVVRWGLLGFIAVISLLYAMFRVCSGRKENKDKGDEQRSATDCSYTILAKLSALALATHGLSSIGMESHATMLMVLFALATSVSICVGNTTTIGRKPHE